LQTQERTKSNKSEQFIVHNNLDRFIINTHAFHNAHLLHATLPRDLVAPIPLFDDRRAKHDILAREFRATLDSKRAKRAETAAKKRKAGDEDDGESNRPKKRAKTRRATTSAGGETMVAGRGRRNITRSEKAKQMDEESDEGTEDEGDEALNSESDGGEYRDVVESD
jgi:hypothetical protein